jgi:hypothetical protein
MRGSPFKEETVTGQHRQQDDDHGTDNTVAAGEFFWCDITSQEYCVVNVAYEYCIPD